MMKIKSLAIYLFFSLSLLGQDSLKVKEEKPDKWNFRIGPYFWFLGINATLEKPPVPSTLPELEKRRFSINKTFAEVANSLKFAFLINTEYYNKRWLGTLNVTSLILEGDAVTPKEILVNNGKYRLSLAFGEASAGYRVVSKGKFKLDLLGGAKLFYSKVDASIKVIGEREFIASKEVTWIEPIIATRFKYNFTPRIEATAYIDYGPRRSQSELTNQYGLYVNFLLNKWLYVAPGYRYWHYRNGSEKSVFNGEMYGFYIRIGAEF
jgi:hypothetical protein